MSKTLEDRVNDANKVLSAIHNGLAFSLENGRLYVVRSHLETKVSYAKRAARTSKNGDWLLHGDGLHIGGTVEQSTVQLLRYIRNQSRQPVRHWQRNWGQDMAELLGSISYDNPQFTCCVLCGSDKGPRGDWWYNEKTKLTGPCCTYGKCLEQKEITTK